ncbi:MAG: MarC family protein [Thermoplasmata archaeon]|nr:MarC family protein [Thermoplasmata archaeon]
MNELGFLLAVTASTFAIVDPVGAVPFFVALTDGFGEADRAFVLRRAVLLSAGLLAGFALFGRFLFFLFGFTLGAFEIAGGILLFLVAYEMLHGKVGGTKLTDADREEAIARRDELSVFPLAIPLLAGPGAISTVMIYEGTAGADPLGIASTFIAIGVTAAATFLCLHFGVRIIRALGRTGVMATTRVMGLLLAAVGVQFVINGVLAVAPHL